jgi:hypothetical protein
MFLLLIFMFFLGIVQVLWAIIHAIATRNPVTRKHFGFYGAGVILYFFILWVMGTVAEMTPEDPLALIHFFGGAFALAAYHFYIVGTSRPVENPHAEGNPFETSEVR